MFAFGIVVVFLECFPNLSVRIRDSQKKKKKGLTDCFYIQRGSSVLLWLLPYE